MGPGSVLHLGTQVPMGRLYMDGLKCKSQKWETEYFRHIFSGPRCLGLGKGVCPCSLPCGLSPGWSRPSPWQVSPQEMVLEIHRVFMDHEYPCPRLTSHCTRVAARWTTSQSCAAWQGRRRAWCSMWWKVGPEVGLSAQGGPL